MNGLQPIQPIDPFYGKLGCEWGGCEKEAVGFRDSDWGDIAVCGDHATADLDGNDSPVGE